MQKKSSPWGTFVVLAIAVVISLARWQTNPPPRKAVATLEAVGFTDIKVTEDHAFFVGFHGCEWADSVAYKATATGANGKRAQVAVCCGWFFSGCDIKVE